MRISANPLLLFIKTSYNIRMKTAMQELMEWLNFYENEPIRPIILKEQIKFLLETENKQIMDSWKEGTKYVMDINEGKNISSMSAIDYLIYFKTEKQDYYTSF